MDFTNNYYYDDDFSDEEESNNQSKNEYFSGIKSWWNNSKQSWEIAKNISPLAFVLSILFTGSDLIISTFTLCIVEPVLTILKTGNLEQVIDNNIIIICLGIITYMLIIWLKPYVLLYLQNTFKDVEVKQKLFIKDILAYIPYSFSIDSNQKYKVHRFDKFINELFSIARDQTKMIVTFFTIIIGFSIGSGMDLFFLICMVISTVFSIMINNQRKIQNFNHENNQAENLLDERLSALSNALRFPSLSTHFANQLHVFRTFFTNTQYQVIDRRLIREKNNLLAERKNTFFDVIMKLCIFGYVFYNIKQGKVLDVIAIYYISSRVCDSLESFGYSIIRQNETSRKIQFVNEIMNVANHEKSMDMKKIYPDISQGISLLLDNVSFHYPGETDYVFKNLDLKIDLNIFYGLQGSNGNGKTTLFKLIAGYLQPNSGSLFINDIPVKNIQRKWFSDVFANYSPEMKIIHPVTVSEFLSIDGFPTNEHTLVIMKQILNEVGLGNKFKNKNIETTILDPGYPDGTDVSSGEGQRLLVARMIMNLIAGAQYVLVDEMTANISFQDQVHLLQLLKKYAKGGIIIAHNPNMINACDELLFCSDTTIVPQLKKEVAKSSYLERFVESFS